MIPVSDQSLGDERWSPTACGNHFGGIRGPRRTYACSETNGGVVNAQLVAVLNIRIWFNAAAMSFFPNTP